MKTLLKKSTTIALLFFLFYNYVIAQTTVNYSDDNGIFCNPERGWHIPAYPIGDPLNKNSLITDCRNAGYTLVHCRYEIDAFKTSPLSESFLNQFQQDLNACRDAGVKMIPVFIYAKNDGDDDASSP